MAQYFAYRYFIIESIQIPLFPELNKKKKEEYFSDLMEQLNAKKKLEFYHESQRYLIYLYKKLTKNINLIEFSKEDIYLKPIEGDNEILEIQDKKYPFVYVILDTERQVILIQNKTSVFRSIDTSKSRLEDFFNDAFRKTELSFAITPITDENEFWQEVSNMDSIFSLQLTLNAPNFFKGRFPAEKFVKETFEDYNYTFLKLDFKSKIGRLRLLKENLADYIDLISAGGGKYILEGIKNGLRFVLRSKSKVVKKELPKEITEIKPEQIENVVKDVDKGK